MDGLAFELKVPKAKRGGGHYSTKHQKIEILLLKNIGCLSCFFGVGEIKNLIHLHPS